MFEHCLLDLKRHLEEHPELENQLPASYVAGIKKFNSENIETIKDFVVALFNETETDDEWCLVFKDKERYQLEPQFGESYYMLHDNNTYQLLKLCYQYFPEEFPNYVIPIVTHPNMHGIISLASEKSRDGDFSKENGLMIWDEFIDHFRVEKLNQSIVDFFQTLLKRKDQIPAIEIQPIPSYQVKPIIQSIFHDEEIIRFDLDLQTLFLNTFISLNDLDDFWDLNLAQFIQFIEIAGVSGLSHMDSYFESLSLFILDKNLVKKSIEIILENPEYSENLTKMMVYLLMLDIFNEDIMTRVQENGHFDTLYELFNFLTDAQLMTKENAIELWDEFLPYIERIEAYDCFHFYLFALSDEYEFTLQDWQEILDRVKNQRPDEELREFINGLPRRPHFVNLQLDLDEDLMELEFDFGLEAHAFNPSQSTHTASVHKSSTKTAIILKNMYQIDNQLELLRDIKVFLLSLDQGNYINAAALRAFEGISEGIYQYRDNKSQTTLLELLLLTWLAIHDDENRIGKKEDAMQLWVDCLYDIQRDYAQKDNPYFEDKPICGSGSFNKLIEGIAATHHMIEMKYISMQTLAYKLKASIQTLLLDYLKTFSNPESFKAFVLFNQMCRAIEINGVEAYWPFMKDHLSQTLFDEFQSLFKDNQDIRYHQMIENGEYTQIQNIKRFQKEIGASKGYYQFCHSCLFQNLNFQEPKNHNSVKMLGMGDI